MVTSDFDAFFADATGHQPYPYQRALAEGSRLPKILHAPTGTGKTEAATLAWLWRRFFHQDPGVREGAPRRLVYCLPMRVLVEQTRDRLENCIKSLVAAGWLSQLSIFALMGGEMRRDWELSLHEESVIIGTQDMLISTALNRGYGMSRFQWPVGFALVNNDVLWVLDEVQLMGASIPTSAQMAAFRKQMGAFGPVHTLWMSATVHPEWLNTIDHESPEGEYIQDLGPADRDTPMLKQRLDATKNVRVESVGKSVKSKAYTTALAKHVLALHRPGTFTLVILNTVERASDLWASLTAQRAKRRKAATTDTPPILLLHSRFRPDDRDRHLAELAQMARSGGGIAISTQVVEAGVDISACTLITELAPWTSLVQRFGRCNRDGSMEEAEVVIIDLPDQSASPYAPEELAAARAFVQQIQSASAAPAALPVAQTPLPLYDVVRRKDLLELFDTTPDISGNDLDLTFVRDSPDTDLHVFWRDIAPGGSPDANEPAPQAAELCPVPVTELTRYLNDAASPAWCWDHLTERWVPLQPRLLRPGQLILLPSWAGCYSPQRGWSLQEKAHVSPVQRATDRPAPEGFSTTPSSISWVTLVEHTDNVASILNELLPQLNLPTNWVNALRTSVRWHDMGKSHTVWQDRALAALTSEERTQRQATIWAKSPAYRWSRNAARAFFRHELASALAYLGQFPEPSDEQFLTAYLIAAHHGRVRLAIRSLPNEAPTALTTSRYALGVADGDIIEPVALGDSNTTPKATLDLSWMELGGNHSWVARACGLRDSATLGPFRLAFLESVVRVADRLASARETEE